MKVIDEKYVELMIKAEKLEKENRTLKDEHCGLKMKTLELEKVIENVETNLVLKHLCKLPFSSLSRYLRAITLGSLPENKEILVRLQILQKKTFRRILKDHHKTSRLCINKGTEKCELSCT